MRKKIIFITLILLASFCFANFSFAQERIIDFSVTAKINHDSSVDIQEIINYDFANLERHGIYREIPVSYQTDKGNSSISISNISVTDQNNNDLQTKISSSGQYLKIKVGNPDKYISGRKTYVISYKVKRAINYFEEHDEFYWNVTGNEWDVPINHASAKIILPEAIKRNNLQVTCFGGRQGSNKQCQDVDLNFNNANLVEKAEFFESNLAAGEGLTIVIGTPKGILKEPSVFKRAINLIWDNKIVFLPIFVILVLFGIWYKKGRDPKGRGTIIAQYEAPDNLSPIEVGTIVDETVHKRDLSAEIIHLAVQGYIKIKRIKKKVLIFSWGHDYLLKQLKPSDSLKKDFQKELLEDLFKDGKEADQKGVIKTIKLSDLKNKFHKDSRQLTKTIYNRVVEQGYFVKNPNKLRTIFIITGIILNFIGARLLSPFFIVITGSIGIVSIIASSTAIVIFGLIMPKKTKKGVLTKEKILGLKEYLEVAEKARIKFHNDPQKDPQLFEKLLPYAMVLKVEKEWAHQFEGIYKGSPAWYEDPTTSSFAPVYFASSMSNFSKSANANLFTSSRGAAGGRSGFGGSGFSGGGFGGGGGGSW